MIDTLQNLANGTVLRDLDKVDAVTKAFSSFIDNGETSGASVEGGATPKFDINNQSSLVVGLGFTAAVLAQLAGSIGLLLLKSSSLYEYHLPPYKRCRLFAGIFFQAIVPIGTDSFAYAVCPLSLLAPLSGITIAATIIFTAARCCGVREPVHASDFAVVALIIAGVTLVNVYGPHSSTNVNMTQLTSYLENVRWIIFSSTCAGLVIIWLAIYCLVDFECLNRLRPHPTSIFTTLGCAFSAACCSMLTQVFLKIVSLAVREAIQYHSFTHAEVAPLIISASLLVVSALTQLYLINATMSSGKVIIAVPSYSAMTIVLTIVGASIFYGDFNTITVSDAINFGVGVFIVAVGIILLSVLQWCRQMRAKRGIKRAKPTEGDSLLDGKVKGGKEEKFVGLPSSSSSSVATGTIFNTDRTPSEGDSESNTGSRSYVLDGGASYCGDGASTFGDGASTFGDGASVAGDSYRHSRGAAHL